MTTINEIRALLDNVSEEHRAQQIADGQMTLGMFIGALEAMPQDAPIRFDIGGWPGKPDSYRGYYEQLAFSCRGDGATVADVLAHARSAMGRVFEGYKGGKFVMHENTLVWGGSYGTSSDGRMIMGVENTLDGVIIRTEDEF